ncbi:MAG: hypothetical protein KA533_00015 [Sphingobium sp.]|nr:hypothetical protein [Sphingobium sp.]MBP6112926.1 hypothetical protein [Sphingobium sp.]MBP8670225.1 hypothetical protein [Sphingobium sp.]MBP9157259.1 hypothetical protein [Sphingobium sp.]
MNLPRILHAEISRRAEGWRDHIVQATGAEAQRRAERAAADIALWLRLANQLGWSTIPPLPPIEIAGALARTLATIDPAEPLRDAADWQSAQASVAQSLSRARVAAWADETETSFARFTGLRTIARALAHAAAAHAARTAPEPQQEAA